MKTHVKIFSFLICFFLVLGLTPGIYAYTDLRFTDSYTFDIGVSYVGESIASYSLAGNVSGGTAPYTFSKVSGADWVKVSADGTVSGTPYKLAENGDTVIRVTDALGDTAEIDIFVAVTAPAPSERTPITRVAAVSTDFVNIPHIGTKAYSPSFTVTEGLPATFAIGTATWQKKDGSNWRPLYLYSGETFTTGTYRMFARVRLEDNAGATHVFAEGVSVSVNGEAWDVTGLVVTDDYSQVTATSPEFVIDSRDVAPTFTLSYDTNGGSSIPDVSGLKYYSNIPAPQSATTREGYTFFGWYMDAELTVAVSWSYPVTEDMTIYAKWVKTDRILESLSFTVSAPTAGANPSFDIRSAHPNLYTAEVDCWYLYEKPYPMLNQSDTFTPGSKYALRYKVTLAEGYVLDSFATATVNGINASVYGSSLDQEVVFDAASFALSGDANLDGKVNNLDATTVLKYDAGIIDLNSYQKDVADVNGDVKVNNLDASMILKYDAGIIDKL